jgi:hypothetical protein
MTKISQLHTARDEGSIGRVREQRRSAFLAAEGDNNVQRSGFSARLNMLCSLAGERDVNNGRLEDITGLNPDWERSLVKEWLCEDRLPSPQQLRALVRFLVERLQDNLHNNLQNNTDATLWEAHLVYGSEVISNPALASNESLLPLAARELLKITDEYCIPPDSYDAKGALQNIIELLEKLNFRSSESKLQPGHRLAIATNLFPDYVKL